MTEQEVELRTEIKDLVARAKALVDMLDEIKDLVAKAKALVDMLDEREKYHGSLVGPETLVLVNNLRLELARWK